MNAQQDEGEALRKAYFTVLGGGALVYDGSPIPVVDEKLDVDITETDLYVLMLTQDGAPLSNKTKSNFSNEIVLQLQIVNQRRSTNSKLVVESVANQILSLLFPDVTTTSLKAVIESPFRLTYALKINDRYNPLVKNENGFLISKVLEFKNRITQQ